jgi:hypothetical protein
MSLSEDLKIDVLKKLMQEDRTEARIIRARIENVVWSIVVASFAITAFWLKPPSQPPVPLCGGLSSCRMYRCS